MIELNNQDEEIIEPYVLEHDTEGTHHVDSTIVTGLISYDKTEIATNSKTVAYA